MAVVRVKSESSAFKGTVHLKMKILSLFALVLTFLGARWSTGTGKNYVKGLTKNVGSWRIVNGGIFSFG